MKKIVYILLSLILVLVSLSCSKKLPPALSKIEKDRKYIDKLEKKTPKGKLPYDENYLTLHKGDTVKNYIDLINSWDFKKEIESPMDSNILKTFIYLNEYRKSLGLSELKYSKELELTAKIQSYYISDVNRNNLSHDNPTSHRLRTIGGRWYWVVNKLMDFDTLSYSISAEIVTVNSSINEITKNFNCAIESFKGSKPHHAAMLVDYYSHVGIYIQDRKNVVIVFGYDKKYSDIYCPRTETYPITHPLIVKAGDDSDNQRAKLFKYVEEQTSKYNKEFVNKK